MYSYSRGNLAYDISRFETDESAVRRPKAKEAKPEIKLHKVSASKTGNWFKTLVFIACAVALAFAVIGSKAAISEVSTRISEENAKLEEAKSEQSRLQSKLDEMVTLDSVEDVAVNQLGLQKTSKNQIHYISVFDRTMVQVSNEQPNVFETLKDWIDGTTEYLGF